jgi:hypothetical protein
VLLISADVFAAYSIDVFEAQQMKYENGSITYRFIVEIFDEEGKYIDDNSFISETVITDPLGKQIPIRDERFSVYDYNLCEKSPDTGEYFLTSTIKRSTIKYYVNEREIVYEPLLVNGPYKIQITTNDGQRLEKTCDYHGSAESLMAISSETFEMRLNESGDLVWTWVFPVLRPAETLKITPTIEFFDGDRSTGFCSISVSNNANSVRIPANSVATLQERSNRFGFFIMVTDTNLNTRMYSDWYFVDDLSSLK